MIGARAEQLDLGRVVGLARLLILIGPRPPKVVVTPLALLPGLLPIGIGEVHLVPIALALRGIIGMLEPVNDNVCEDWRGLRLGDGSGDADVRVDESHCSPHDLVDLVEDPLVGSLQSVLFGGPGGEDDGTAGAPAGFAQFAQGPSDLK